MPVLSATSSLADIFSFGFGRFFDGLFVGHLRTAHISFNRKLPLHAINNNFQVQFSHSRNYGLARFLISFDLKSWVLLSKAAESQSHLFLVCFGFRLNLERNYGL